jgi:hypothetical protein
LHHLSATVSFTRASFRRKNLVTAGNNSVEGFKR